MTFPTASALRLLVSLVVAAVTVAAVSMVAGAVGRAAPARPEGAPAPPAAAAPVDPWPEQASGRAVRVLEEWQMARARAYSSGDVAELRRLYARGSRAGRRDVAVLGAYAARGLSLELVVRTSRLSVLVARPRLVVLRLQAQVLTVARLVGERRALPSTGWQGRRVTLRLAEGSWRLSAASRGWAGSPREPP